MNMIRDKKLSIICSESEGCGRKSVITMAARYLWERSRFQGGVFHIKNNFKPDKFKGNFDELILHTLDIAGIDGYQEIVKFYYEQGSRYRDKTQLAVDLLYQYTQNKKRPICLLLSDFDQMPFMILDKYSFICQFIDRFDEEIEEPPEIGTRLIITCALNRVGELQNFMDHIYAPSQHQAITYNDPRNRCRKKNKGKKIKSKIEQ